MRRRAFLSSCAALLATACATAPASPDSAALVRRLLTLSTENAFKRIVGIDGVTGEFAAELKLGQLLTSVVGQASSDTVLSMLRSIGLFKAAQSMLSQAAAFTTRQLAPFVRKRIDQIDIQDAAALLRDGDDSATRYLERSINQDLAQQIKPLVIDFVRKAQQTEDISQFTAFLGERLSTTFATIIAEKMTGALGGALFNAIAREEKALRANPARILDTALAKALARR